MMILDYITENHIELVVMGTKGASGLRELLIGSNAERIVRRSSCPVITVRTYEKLRDIKNIVFPNSLEVEQDDLVEHVKVLQRFLKAATSHCMDKYTWQFYQRRHHMDKTEGLCQKIST